jgi:hypothetical protein
MERKGKNVTWIYVYCLLIDSVNDPTMGTKNYFSEQEKENKVIDNYFRYIQSHRNKGEDKKKKTKKKKTG